jgi:hypothetical protein
MEIIRTTTCEDLGKTMPHGVLRMVTAEDHNRAFYAYDTTDVWTSDGWLVTAVQDDGVTHHLRKGREVVVAKLAPETMLHFKPTPKTLYMLGETA